ncbi:minor tail protein [Microbacterium phage Hendrix]|uniref:Minor tail protein n=1 Tax=Microbacterium phage Hendrix TaxID=2182341 RepID=A0A2U8UUJ8_9CAUD|nr:minor tail protein [Microbacterium phage Hendrix]AWN07742.1 minor tail protein [Microbacterium phage Hendrix]
MTYEGYVAFGGNEVVNNERARGYAQTAECPMFWLKDDPDQGLAPALGDIPYVYSDITASPWYDSTIDEISRRFFGVYGLEVRGVEDSTRTATVTESIDDGGVIGRPRSSTRNVTVRALLLGKGRDAIEYGMSWMAMQLDADACGQVSRDCGVATMDVFSTAPPVRGEVPDISDWQITRRNLLTNPRIISSNTGWTSAYSSSATASGMQVVMAGGLAPETIMMSSAAIATTPGENRSVGITIEVPAGFPAMTFSVVAFAEGPEVILSRSGSVTIQPGESRYLPASAPRSAPSGTTAVRLQVRVGGTEPSPLLSRFYAREAIMADQRDPGAFFSGATPNTETERFTWTGTANASTTTEERKLPILRPRTDAEYGELVDYARRFMRNSAVISGPLKLTEQASGDFWAYEVQFVLAGGPSILGVTKSIALSPSTPTVVQDIVYNLIPYTNAVLGSGSIVIATNLAQNPSVETNATGWSISNSVISGSSPTAFLTGARSTDVAAIGTASFRVRLLGDNGATVVSASVCDMIGYQDVPIPAGVGRRVSLSLWGAVFASAGATPNTALQSLNARYLFLNNGAAVGGTTVFGTTPTDEFGGKVHSLIGLTVPDSATHIRVSLAARVTWTSSAAAGQNSDIRLYGDALMVSVP